MMGKIADIMGVFCEGYIAHKTKEINDPFELEDKIVKQLCHYLQPIASSLNDYNPCNSTILTMPIMWYCPSIC
jgi:hypothetical protein